MVNYFISATDTDAGKTYVACALTYALVNQSDHNYRVAVFKPISAGCELNNEGQLENEDALQLKAQANCQQTLQQINPITFAEPIAPHIAAQKTKQPIELDQIFKHYKSVQNNRADITITEGAGGWRLPLGKGKYLSDFVKIAKQEVILVVNMKLGCLNHAVLTYETIINDGLRCIAWVANCPEDMPYLFENIAELTALLPAPLLATLDYSTDISVAAAKFNLSVLAKN